MTFHPVSSWHQMIIIFLALTDEYRDCISNASTAELRQLPFILDSFQAHQSMEALGSSPDPLQRALEL